jgi:hypothetical protein
VQGPQGPSLQSQSTEQGLPGTLPGTEQWLIVLRTRGYSLPTALQAARTHASSQARQAGVDGLRLLAANDQQDIAQVVMALGGAVRQHFWAVNALAVDVPPAARIVLSALPRVARLYPVGAHQTVDASMMQPAAKNGAVLPVPIERSTDSLNHNVLAAWNVLGGPGSNGGFVPYRGLGARVVVLDTGIDADVFGIGTPTPHPAFLDGAPTPATRIEAHLRAGSVDVNMCEANSPMPAIGTTPPIGFRYNKHSQNAAHGTTMAAIIAGRSYNSVDPITGSNVSFSGTGHAPDARIIDLSASQLALPVPGAPPSQIRPWEFTDATLLSSVEMLRSYILVNRPPQQQTAYVHVMNLSIAGRPSPSHPVNLAFDSLARDEDILLIGAAGNQGDTTQSSGGFYHGLAVAAVHARHVGDPSASLPQPKNLAFQPIARGSTGPLFGDPDRFFPDVCATGAGPNFFYLASFVNSVSQTSCLSMPGIDILDSQARTPTSNNVSPYRYNLGSSQATSQVSGAAALYRGFRSTQANPSSAEETRAAILLNVIGTYAAPDGLSANASTKHSYNHRNRLGVGYVRDDLLAQFAKRDPSVRPLVQTVSLNPTASADVTYSGIQPGKRYGVVLSWRRWYLSDGDQTSFEGDLPNVDLEIASQGNVIARSHSKANSYERVVFNAPSNTTSVLVRAILRNPTAAPTSVPLPVQVVAREFASDIDPSTPLSNDPVMAASGNVASQPSGPACVSLAKAWPVTRTLPTVYDGAWGGLPFNVTYAPNQYYYTLTNVGHNAGVNLLHPSQPGYLLSYVYSGGVGSSMTFDAIAFRTHSPFSPTQSVSGGYVQVDCPGSSATGTAEFRAPGVLAGDARQDGWNVIVPLSSPVSYQGGSLTISLGGGSGGSVFLVDGIDDGPGSGYWTSTSGPLGPQAFPGRVPIVGLIQSQTISSSARLELFGEPISGGSPRELQWRLSEAPPNTTWVLFTGGWSPTALPHASTCPFWLTSPSLIQTVTTDAFGLGGGRLAIPINAVHQEIGLQCIRVSPSSLSNALRVTFGGAI